MSAFVSSHHAYTHHLKLNPHALCIFFTQRELKTKTDTEVGIRFDFNLMADELMLGIEATKMLEEDEEEQAIRRR